MLALFLQLWNGLKRPIHTRLVKLSQAEWFLEDTLEAVLLNEQELVPYMPRMEQTLAPYAFLDTSLNTVLMEHGTRKENMSAAKGWPYEPWTIISWEDVDIEGRTISTGYYAFNTRTGERKLVRPSHAEAMKDIPQRYAEPWGV